MFTVKVYYIKYNQLILSNSYGGLHEDYSYSLWLDMLDKQCAESEIQKDMEQLGFIFN